MEDLFKEIDNQRLEFLQGLTPEDMLRELLAGIHGDGGHHTESVGLAQSVLNAENKLAERMEEIDRLRSMAGGQGK